MLNNENVKQYFEVGTQPVLLWANRCVFLAQSQTDQTKETYRYLLPTLLHIPIHHFEQYLVYLEV